MFNLRSKAGRGDRLDLPHVDETIKHNERLLLNE